MAIELNVNGKAVSIEGDPAMPLPHALDVARSLGETDIVLLGDSAQIVNQANGVAKCRDDASRAFARDWAAQRAAFRRLRVRQIGRAQNLAGIALEKLRAI